ncbi:MAG: UDP-N-acetyl-D-glucosamine dehydrogenase [candidate division Zixibacteria bacterium HGW-Zixibacteria-1]|nr:MAG: UDP-N-acetyl-D-glucosamine dehydrogenase [candidate division Zixibacteria bacterium HGW-Zixibacteria-1]
MTNDLIKKIKNREAVIGIVGLGYVGLPLAVEFAEAGFTVYGYDISKSKVKLISAGKSDIDDVPDKVVEKLVKSGNLVATDDPRLMKKVDTMSICVPTPLSKTKDPDVSYILSAVEMIKQILHKDMLIILESTTYPGTTEDMIKPLLEDSGFKMGKDIFLAFSPERVDPGNTKFMTGNTPRVVGGITPRCTKIAKVFYEQIINTVIPMSSTKAAEMVKLLENTFRSVNIGLVNEVALMCDRLGLNVWEIIDAAATKPFGFMPFYPGPGLGGHCIPIDPHYLSWKLKSLNYYARFIELAGDINSHMPEYVVERVRKLLNHYGKSVKGSNILILGVAYKKDIKDMRESPALDVMKLLEKDGAKLHYNDPHVPEIRWNEGSHRSVKLTAGLLNKADLVIILTNHTSYNYHWIVENSKLIFDSRNAAQMVKSGRNKITTL